MAELSDLEGRLWAAADELRANSTLTAAQYRDPVLGLIFLAFAEHRFEQLRPELEAKATVRRLVTADDFRAHGVLYVPEAARLSHLVELPEALDLGTHIDQAMDAIEEFNSGLTDVLPRGYQKLEKSTLVELVRLFAPLPRTLSGDAFGLIYEYFLSNFASAEGRLGGEFFTPQSIVRLIVEVIEPFHGKVYDPACGSGGMFVHCAKFVAGHSGSPSRDLTVFGQEQKEATIPVGHMNLALHGISGDIRLANSYYEDLHDSVGRFDFVMANPPFNVDKIDKAKLADDRSHFPFGLPRPDNGNYLSFWIEEGKLLAGKYAGAKNETDAAAKLRALAAAGVTLIIDLTDQNDHLEPYSHHVTSPMRRINIPVTDLHAPTITELERTLELIDAELQSDGIVYVHCWGGCGRTGAVVASWLVKHGRTAKSALEHYADLSLSVCGRPCPEAREQCALVEEYAAKINATPAADAP